MTSAVALTSPSRMSKRSAPASSQPSQRCEGLYFYALAAETPEPGAQERGRFHGLGKYAAARAGEGRDAQLLAPGSQLLGRQGFDGGTKMRRGAIRSG